MIMSKEIEDFIERYCREWKISREEALTHAVVKNIIAYYKDVEKAKIEAERGPYDSVSSP